MTLDELPKAFREVRFKLKVDRKDLGYRELTAIIEEEKLKPDETRKLIENAFRDGSVKTTGTDIDKIMPPISRFGGGNREEKKQGIITKLLKFFESFFGIG